MGWRGSRRSFFKRVVVAMQRRRSLALASAHLQDAVHDGDVPVFDFEYHNLSHPNRVVLVVQEQYVASLKRRLHRAAEHHHHGALALGHEHEP